MSFTEYFEPFTQKMKLIGLKSSILVYNPSGYPG